MSNINGTHITVTVLSQGKKLLELSGFVLDEEMPKVELSNLLFNMEQNLNSFNGKHRFHISTKVDNDETRLDEAIKEYGK